MDCKSYMGELPRMQWRTVTNGYIDYYYVDGEDVIVILPTRFNYKWKIYNPNDTGAYVL